MVQIPIREATEQLDKLIQAAANGEEIFIIADDQQVVQLVPVPILNRRAQFGSAKGLIRMTDDFDAPLPDFGEYM